jgi:hypothetical protein
VTSPTQDRAPLGLARVDQVLVVATLRRIHDPEASEAFVVAVEVPPGERLDEEGLLDELGAAPSALGPQALWSLDVTRAHAGTGTHVTDSRAEVRLDVVVPTSQTDAAVEVLESLWARIRSLATTAAQGLDRETAIGRAREVVALAWDVDANRLRVSDEEHHPEHGGWTIGLVDGDVGRYEVDLGVVDGDPHTAHVRRHAATEVADSVGESG